MHLIRLKPTQQFHSENETIWLNHILSNKSKQQNNTNNNINIQKKKDKDKITKSNSQNSKTY
jgi:hypothetical protein